ncbi:MAG: transporter [Burkholderiaceae bacterium]
MPDHTRAAATRAVAAAVPALAAAILPLVFAATAHAEQDQYQDAINTERPSFVDSPDAVGKGRFQIEAGVQQERDDTPRGRDRTITTPVLLRIGTGDRWEVLVETDGRVIAHGHDETGRGTTEAGYADTAVGAKWVMRDQAGLIPAVGWIGELALDTGSDAFRGNGVRPSLRMVTEWKLPHDFSVGMMPGLVLDRDERGGHFASGLFGIVLNRSFGERLKTFVEFAAPQIARADNGGTQLSYDAGVAWLLSRDWQIDTALFKGANDNTPDLTWTVGLSGRF